MSTDATCTAGEKTVVSVTVGVCQCPWPVALSEESLVGVRTKHEATPLSRMYERTVGPHVPWQQVQGASTAECMER
jgi:hypothetical protein